MTINTSSGPQLALKASVTESHTVALHRSTHIIVSNENRTVEALKQQVSDLLVVF